MRMADADDLVAVDVFNAAKVTGEPLTMTLVRRVIDDLLTHSQTAAADTARPQRSRVSRMSGTSRRVGKKLSLRTSRAARRVSIDIWISSTKDEMMWDTAHFAARYRIRRPCAEPVCGA